MIKRSRPFAWFLGMIALIGCLNHVDSAPSSVKSIGVQPAHSSAIMKALSDAHGVLNKTDSRPREVDAITQMLNNSKLRSLTLPRGSKAWCPLLSVRAKGSLGSCHQLHACVINRV